MKMSSEELRLDLESFINAGLARGSRGWPRKIRKHCVAGNAGRRRALLRTSAYPTHLPEETEIRAFEAVSEF